MNQVQITLFNSVDLEEFTKLLIDNNLPIEGLENSYENLLILRKDGELVGGVGLEIYSDSALLRSLVVDASYRGHGYGKFLIEQILQLAKDKQVTNVYLLTETAAALFSKIGFTEYPRDQVPTVIAETEEFAYLCPTSSTTMYLSLS